MPRLNAFKTGLAAYPGTYWPGMASLSSKLHQPELSSSKHIVPPYQAECLPDRQDEESGTASGSCGLCHALSTVAQNAPLLWRMPPRSQQLAAACRACQVACKTPLPSSSAASTRCATYTAASEHGHRSLTSICIQQLSTGLLAAQSCPVCNSLPTPRCEWAAARSQLRKLSRYDEQAVEPLLSIGTSPILCLRCSSRTSPELLNVTSCQEHAACHERLHILHIEWWVIEWLYS